MNKFLTPQRLIILAEFTSARIQRFFGDFENLPIKIRREPVFGEVAKAFQSLSMILLYKRDFLF